MNTETERAIRGFQIGVPHTDRKTAEELVSSMGVWIETWREIIERGDELGDPDKCTIPTDEFVLLMQEVYRLQKNSCQHPSRGATGKEIVDALDAFVAGTSDEVEKRAIGRAIATLRDVFGGRLR